MLEFSPAESGRRIEGLTIFIVLPWKERGMDGNLREKLKI